MKVSELMTRNVQSCTPETNLSTAAMQMWDGDFGTLPVLDGDGKVVGMITDRDICIAAATRHQDIATINVGEVINGQVQSCTPDMSISDTLKVLEKAQVRRLPVVDKDQKLQGILSINDIVHYTGDVKKSSGVSHADVVNSLKSICAQRVKATAAGA